MKVQKTNMNGLYLITPKVFFDERGYFLESYNEDALKKEGIQFTPYQVNQSFSKKGVIRGLHFQNPNAQSKLVSVLRGRIIDVAVDLRRNSSTFRGWYSVVLDEYNRDALFVPDGFAHGFQVISDYALVQYLTNNKYDKQNSHILRYDDVSVGVEWLNMKRKILSPNDEKGLSLDELIKKGLI
jgi:dTDP-4-dehydrorhamnose 3,5-epimerase